MKADRGLWLAALGGALAFLAITHGAILDPRATGWLLSHPDTATTFLGWQFFRQAPLLQFPFGANPAYGLEIATSVVFSDSIPLAAFLFKPLSGVLPAQFQYFGLWLALSFVLQAALAYRLLLRFCQDRTLAVIGSAFFVLAPAFLFRLGGHYSLCGQWVLLAGLCLYFAPRFSPWAWTALLATSALIHFYLLVMVGMIWAAGDLWQRRWRNEITARRAATHFVVGAAVTLIVLWFAGYFMIGSAASAMPGFGTYRLNLLALIDPDAAWSRLLPDQPGGPGDFEGFSYLGTGMLLLAPLAAYRLLAKRSATALERSSLVPLVFVSSVLTLIALSNRVALGNVELFAYEVPEVLQPFADVLRGSGRMFWPVFYLLYLAILVAVFRGFRRRVAIGACVIALTVQVVDGARALNGYHDRLARAPAWVSPLKSPLWTEIATRYRRVIYVLPRNAFDAFLPWAAFAADHGMAINFGYFARIDAEKLTAARNDLERAILANQLQRDNLYVFESQALWNMASAQKRPADVVGVLDGFRIIAPNLSECTACALADVKREESPGYALGERISFAAGAASRPYALLGWALPEDWGMWSQAATASVVIKLGRAPARDLLLTIEGRAFVDPTHRAQQVEVSVNGVRLDTLTFASPRAPESRTLRVPQAALAGSKGLVMIRFAFPEARARALGLIALRLSEG